MRLIPWLIALLAFAFGYSLWRVEDRSPLILRVDRTYQDWLIDTAQLPKRNPVPIVLVEMEDAETWTALEYSLFLKALPVENAPVVVIDSLPATENTAYSRAFDRLCLQQPRLILPVQLSIDRPSERENHWWLKGWLADSAEGDVPEFRSVRTGPPEPLRGNVAVGVANPPRDTDRTPLYFRLGGTNIPSLALRASMLAQRISDDQIQWDNGLLLGRQRLPLGEKGQLSVDPNFLPGIPRIASTDLLLKLSGTEIPGHSLTTTEQLQGVLILGNLSASAHTMVRPNRPPLAPAEWIAATVATICNGPVLTPLPPARSLLILLGCVLTPLTFFRQPGSGKWLAVVVLFTAYLAVSIFFATRHAVSAPLFVPGCTLIFGAVLQHLAALYRQETYE